TEWASSPRGTNRKGTPQEGCGHWYGLGAIGHEQVTCTGVNASRKLRAGSGWQATSACGATAAHRPAVREGGCGCRSPPTEPQSERGEVDVHFLFTRGLGAGNEHFRSEFQRQPAVLGLQHDHLGQGRFGNGPAAPRPAKLPGTRGSIH